MRFILFSLKNTRITEDVKLTEMWTQLGWAFLSGFRSGTYSQNSILADDQVPKLIRDPLQTRSQGSSRLKNIVSVKLMANRSKKSEANG